MDIDFELVLRSNNQVLAKETVHDVRAWNKKQGNALVKKLFKKAQPIPTAFMTTAIDIVDLRDSCGYSFPY